MRENELLKDELILPVLQLFAVDTHSTLVALGNTDFVWATLYFLAGVFSGVYICRRTGDHLIHNSNDFGGQRVYTRTTIISKIILGYRETGVYIHTVRTNKNNLQFFFFKEQSAIVCQFIFHQYHCKAN